ncbi:hypothetical protein [Streptomyces hoynatensis]|uniref:Secreted protein n=1 Tax=Streptomyces hoynatensis TaxID=1141874 RepID=A0A3A9YSB7_9ACTN|nr:hypothetical protein [Streptomyces hoynatensis]RKN38187.1 hypothetical protein D7294_25440 [Streptomyces hoynatensis]
MPLPAGHDALPHTRTRPAHWLITAAALAAAAGLAVLLQPSDAGATAEATPGAAAESPPPGEPETPAPGASQEPAGAPQEAPDAAEATYPLDCGPFEVAVTDQAVVDLESDGQPETVAVVRCDAASGSPPNGVYLLTAPARAGDPPRVEATLVDPAERMTVDRLRAEDASISLRLFGYSSPDVPRCCPDLQRDVSWSLRDGVLTLDPAPPPNSI